MCQWWGVQNDSFPWRNPLMLDEVPLCCWNTFLLLVERSSTGWSLQAEICQQKRQKGAEAMMEQEEKSCNDRSKPFLTHRLAGALTQPSFSWPIVRASVSLWGLVRVALCVKLGRQRMLTNSVGSTFVRKSHWLALWLICRSEPDYSSVFIEVKFCNTVLGWKPPLLPPVYVFPSFSFLGYNECNVAYFVSRNASRNWKVSHYIIFEWWRIGRKRRCELPHTKLIGSRNGLINTSLTAAWMHASWVYGARAPEDSSPSSHIL